MRSHGLEERRRPRTGRPFKTLPGSRPGHVLVRPSARDLGQSDEPALGDRLDSPAGPPIAFGGPEVRLAPAHDHEAPCSGRHQRLEARRLGKVQPVRLPRSRAPSCGVGRSEAEALRPVNILSIGRRDRPYCANGNWFDVGERKRHRRGAARWRPRDIQRGCERAWWSVVSTKSPMVRPTSSGASVGDVCWLAGFQIAARVFSNFGPSSTTSTLPSGIRAAKGFSAGNGSAPAAALSFRRGSRDVDRI